jgi:hypothetical protein
MGLLDEAVARGIFPAALNTAGVGEPATTWGGWNEGDEATITSDNIYIAFMEGGLGADETGQGGGLAGADLVLEDADNTILATAGTPPYRTMSNDAFCGTTDAIPHFVRDSTTGWCLVFKFTPTMGAAMKVMQWANNGFGGSNQVNVDINAVGKLFVQVVNGAGVSNINYASAVALTTGVLTWVVIQDNCVETKCGYRQTIRPLAWADMAEVATGPTTIWNVANELDWVGHANCGLYGRNDLASPFVGDAYYFLVARKALVS